MDDEELDKKLLALREKFIDPASMLIAVQRYHGEQVRNESRRAFGRMIAAHLLLTGVLGSIFQRINAKFRLIRDSAGERSAVMASFVIGMEAVEATIEEGRYMQAMALLRQEMETVAQLIAIRLNNRTEGRPPHVGVLEHSIRRLYDELSAGAHLSKHYVVRTATEWDLDGVDAPGPSTGTRCFPKFDEQLARRMFSLHLVLMIEMIKEVTLDHSTDDFDQPTEEEQAAVDLAVSALKAEGMIV